MTKISDLTELLGAGVDQANDLLPIVDMSAAGAARNKKIKVTQLLGLITDIVGMLELKGSTDCSANPNYPAASKGDTYRVSVAGKIGGASGVVVEAGDVYYALADNAGGNQATVGTSWDVIQGNGSFLPLTGGTLSGDVVVPAEVYGPGWNGSNEAPTKNDVYDKVESLAGGVPTNLDNLADVNAPTPANGDVLTYNSGGGVWEPQAPTGGGSVTSWKQVVRAATVANGTLASAFENGDTIDGVTLATGDRILIKDQTTATENGIYTVNASGAPTRSTDADAGSEMLGAIIPISEGTVNAKRVYQCTNTGTITLGSTNLTFQRFNWRYEGGPVGAPTTTTLGTWINQGTSTVTDGTDLMIIAPQVDGLIHAREMATPSAPFDIYARIGFDCSSSAANTSNVQGTTGIILRDSSGGKLINVGSFYERIAGDEQLTYSILVQRWTNGTTFSANAFQRYTLRPWNWLRVNVTSTTITIYASPDGKNWLQIGTETIATFVAAVDRVGFGGLANSNTTTAWLTCNYFSATAPA